MTIIHDYKYVPFGGLPFAWELYSFCSEWNISSISGSKKEVTESEGNMMGMH